MTEILAKHSMIPLPNDIQTVAAQSLNTVLWLSGYLDVSIESIQSLHTMCFDFQNTTQHSQNTLPCGFQMTANTPWTLCPMTFRWQKTHPEHFALWLSDDSKYTLNTLPYDFQMTANTPWTLCPMIFRWQKTHPKHFALWLSDDSKYTLNNLPSDFQMTANTPWTLCPKTFRCPANTPWTLP